MSLHLLEEEGEGELEVAEEAELEVRGGGGEDEDEEGGASEAEVAAVPVCLVRGERRRSGQTVRCGVGGWEHG